MDPHQAAATGGHQTAPHTLALDLTTAQQAPGGWGGGGSPTHLARPPAGPTFTLPPHTFAGGGASAEVTAWPEFHNGAAAGLRLAPAPPPASRQRGSGGTTGGTTGGTSSSRRRHPALAWCALERPEQPSFSHAGTLLALGLTGHLDSLAWTDLYRCEEVWGCVDTGTLLALGLTGHLDSLAWTDLYRCEEAWRRQCSLGCTDMCRCGKYWHV